MDRYRPSSTGGDAEGEELFSAPALQASLGGAGRQPQTHEALRKRLAPVKAVQLACRFARLVLVGTVDAGGDEAALDLAREKEATADYKAPPPPPPPAGGARAYSAPPPSPRFMVRSGPGGGSRNRALGGK